jgi:hypothetical protein
VYERLNRHAYIDSSLEGYGGRVQEAELPCLSPRRARRPWYLKNVQLEDSVLADVSVHYSIGRERESVGSFHSGAGRAQLMERLHTTREIS